MRHKSYFLNTEKKEKLDIFWEGPFNNFTVKLDNNELGVFRNKHELKKGRSFVIGYNKMLEIRMEMQLGFIPCIGILLNDKPVPGTMTDPAKQLAGIFQFMLFIAVINILAGLTRLTLDIKALDDHGIGLNSIIYGTLFIMMALLLKKRESMFALLAVISLIALDIIFILVRIAEYGIQLSNPWSTILIRILFILYLCKGFTIITKLKQQNLIETEQKHIENGKKQRTPLSEQKTKDHTSYMPKDNSKYVPDG